jgi:hypothetical protein
VTCPIVAAPATTPPLARDIMMRRQLLEDEFLKIIRAILGNISPF